MRRGGDFDATYQTQLRHFSYCIRKNKKPECTLEYGRRALQVALGALDSGFSGEVVRIA